MHNQPDLHNQPRRVQVVAIVLLRLTLPRKRQSIRTASTKKHMRSYAVTL